MIKQEVEARLERLGVKLEGNSTQCLRRMSSLELAQRTGVDDETFTLIAEAGRLFRVRRTAFWTTDGTWERNLSEIVRHIKVGRSTWTVVNSHYLVG